MGSRLAPLTSVRFFAAFAVIAFHSYLTNGTELARQHPTMMRYAGPVLVRGDLAVDLFFMLSGLVLAWNYLDRLGPRFSLPVTVRYLRARVARVYPVYLILTAVGGLTIWMRHQYWHEGPFEQLHVGALVRQVLMVQQWTAPRIDTTSWCGPAWSISCEWLAYLALPLVMLAVWRLRTRPRLLLVLAALAMAPLLVVTWRHGSAEFEFSWAYRIVCDFTAGTLLGTALQRIDPSPRARRLAEVGFVAVLVASVLWVQLVPARWGDLILVLWLPLLGLLAVSTGPLTRLLNARLLVLGGQVSYALYLLHGPVFKMYRDVATSAGVPASVRPYGEMLVAIGCIPVAWLLFRFVEEPLRHRFTASPARVPAPVPSEA